MLYFDFVGNCITITLDLYGSYCSSTIYNILFVVLQSNSYPIFFALSLTKNFYSSNTEIHKLHVYLVEDLFKSESSIAMLCNATV